MEFNITYTRKDGLVKPITEDDILVNGIVYRVEGYANKNTSIRAKMVLKDTLLSMGQILEHFRPSKLEIKIDADEEVVNGNPLSCPNTMEYGIPPKELERLYEEERRYEGLKLTKIQERPNVSIDGRTRRFKRK